MLLDGKLLHTLVGHADNLTDVQLTPDGLHVVSGSLDKTIRGWRVTDGSFVRMLFVADGLFSMYVMTGIWIDRYNIRQRLQRHRQ